MVVSWTWTLASGTQVLPTDYSVLYSLAHNNETKSHLQSPDAKEKSSSDLKRFNKELRIDALVAICSSLRDLEIQQAASLCITKLSCKIDETLPRGMPNACAILPPEFTYQEYTRSRTFLYISSSMASSGRPNLASSSKDFLLHLNSPTMNLTWA